MLHCTASLCGTLLRPSSGWTKGCVGRVATNVYADAFNLYYGCLKHTSYRWLDLGTAVEARG